MVHVASSWRLRRNEAENGRSDGIGCGAVEVGRKYPSLAVIFISSCMGILVFWLDL
jgi:hypothetical protein